MRREFGGGNNTDRGGYKGKEGGATGGGIYEKGGGIVGGGIENGGIGDGGINNGDGGGRIQKEELLEAGTGKVV